MEAVVDVVELNDRSGTLIAKLKVGWTKDEVMRRVPLVGPLLNRSGLPLDRDEKITVDEAPYSSMMGPNTEHSARKKQKDFSTVLQTADYKEASRILLDTAITYRGDEPDDPKTYCVPSHGRMINSTWNKDEMQKQLVDLRDKIKPMLKEYAPRDRNQVVIGLRLGTGFGKTHILTRFPEWLSAAGIYVTYNDDQILDTDVKAPDKAIYIRLILAMHGWSSKMCSQFINSEQDSSPFWQSTPQQLRDLFVNEAKKKFKQGPIAIGVDELKELHVSRSKIVLSELAGTAAQYLKETSSMCTVMVSSLVSKTFRTHSGRSVMDWTPSRPSIETLVYFAERVHQDNQEQAKALVNAVSGAHMRSIVVAFDLYIKNRLEPTVHWMYEQMKVRMGAKEETKTLSLVVDYVKRCMSEPCEIKSSEDVEVLCDQTGSIPPIFLMMAFEFTKGKEHLENLLNAFSLFDGGPGKHLEAVAKHYDLFRAELGLPVVPGSARVNTDMQPSSDKNWYRQLLFPVELKLSDCALLERKGGKIVPTDVIPKFGHYYHPKISNHPYIDRAFVASNQKELCLVLAQDKVNRKDFPEACRKLNEAARLLTANSTTLNDVLLIINVIGATTATTGQSQLEWPFVLIRGEQEVKDFYTAHFADMVWFARQRHLLSFESSTVSGE